MATGIFTISNSTNSVLESGYKTFARNVRFRDANSALESSYNYSFNKIPQSPTAFIVKDNDFNHLFFGKGDNGVSTLPNLVDLLGGPSIATGILQFDFDPLAAQKTTNGWIIKNNKLNEFNRLQANYFETIEAALKLVTIEQQKNLSLQNLLTKYYFSDYKNGVYQKELADGNVNSTKSIDYRAYYAVNFKNNGTDNTFVFVKNNENIDVTYPYHTNAEIQQGTMLSAKRYLDLNHYNTGHNISFNSNKQQNLKFGGVGYVADFVNPTFTGLFDIGFFHPKTENVVIVNPTDFYSHLNLSPLGMSNFIDMHYNSMYDAYQKSVFTSNLNSWFSHIATSKKGTNNSPFKFFYNGSDPSFYLNNGLINLQRSTKNSSIFNVILISIILSIAAIIILFIIRRRVDDARIQIGVLKAQGYGTFKVAVPFCIFGIISAFLGCLLGVGIGWAISSGLNSTAIGNFVGPFSVFVFSWIPLVVPLLLALVILILVSFFSAFFILRKNARVLLSPGSSISVNRVAVFLQGVLKRRRFETKFRFAFILASPVKNLIVFFSFMLSSFMLLFSIILSSVFSNVLSNTLNGLSFNYTYSFLQNSPSSKDVSAIGRYALEKRVNFLQPTNEIIGSADGQSASYNRALQYNNNAISFINPTNADKVALYGLLANNGTLYDAKGNFNDSNGLLGTYLNSETFNAVFNGKQLSFQQKVTAWITFLKGEFLNQLYTTKTAVAKPNAAFLNKLTTDYNGSAANKFLAKRTLNFNSLSTTDFVQFSRVYIPKLTQLIVKGIALDKGHTVDLGVATYDTKTDLPYLRYSADASYNGITSSMSFSGFEAINKLDGTQETINDFNHNLNQQKLNALGSYNAATGTLPVYVNKGALRNFHTKVGDTIITPSLFVTVNGVKTPLKIQIKGVINGFFQTQAFTNYNALKDMLTNAAQPGATNIVNSDGLNASKVINAPPPKTAGYFNAFFSKSNDNLLATHAPLYFDNSHYLLLNYGFSIKSALSLNQIKSILQKVQTLFTLMLTVIIAFSCIISLVIVIAMTNIVINENKTMIAIMKLLGYPDKQINWLFLSVYLVIILLAFLISIGFVYLTFSLLQNFLYNSLNIFILVLYPWWSFVVDLIVVLTLFLISFLISWFAIKKIGLLLIIQKEN